MDIRFPTNTGVMDPSSFANLDPATSNEFPVVGQQDDMIQTTGTDRAWNADFEAQFPSWLINDDFDLGLLNTPIAATMAEIAPSWPNPPRGSSDVSPIPLASMKHLWFTHLSNSRSSQPPSGTVTPRVNPHQTDVDEDYRHSLHKRLRVRPLEHSLPSSEFLNLCVRLYFARFNSVFPVVHAATFRPSAENSMLLLSICSVGSLFTGSANAAAQGVQIFENLNKAVLATWDRLISREAEEVIPMIQAALIGQTFGLLSGDPKHLATVDSFHGTVISWARRSKMFDTRHSSASIDISNPEALNQRWREWARTEEMIRIALGLHIHDAELSAIFHHEPFFRHAARPVPMSASNEIFMASTSRDWAALYRTQTPYNFASQTSPSSLDTPSSGGMRLLPFESRFTIYAALEGIAATITENRFLGLLDSALVEEFGDKLMTFYLNYQKDYPPYEPDNFGITILWHLTFMSLFVDFDLLERAVGRDGPQIAAGDLATIIEWASSVHAKRCIIHASLIHKKMDTMSIGFEPPIHVPRSMFLAAITWYCYTRYGSDTYSHETTGRDLFDFAEIRLLDVNPALLLFEANGFRHGKPTAIEASGALCGLTDLLQRVGHWEIARKFGQILGALIHSETDRDG